MPKYSYKTVKSTEGIKCRNRKNKENKGNGQFHDITMANNPNLIINPKPFKIPINNLPNPLMH